MSLQEKLANARRVWEAGYIFIARLLNVAFEQADVSERVGSESLDASTFGEGWQNSQVVIDAATELLTLNSRLESCLAALGPSIVTFPCWYTDENDGELVLYSARKVRPWVVYDDVIPPEAFGDIDGTAGALASTFDSILRNPDCATYVANQIKRNERRWRDWFQKQMLMTEGSTDEERQLATPTQKSTVNRPKKRGRKPNSNAEEDKRIYDAWQTRRHSTYAEHAKEFGRDKHEMKLAVDRERKRRKK